MSEAIAKYIRVLRGQPVILDVDLADLYGVASERLIELVKCNQPKFTVEFAFSVEPDELRDLEPRVACLAFTEHGVINAASVLNSPHAVEMSIQVVRAFVKLREAVSSDSELVRRVLH
jgi:ORF6N domain-containing protein